MEGPNDEDNFLNDEDNFPNDEDYKKTYSLIIPDNMHVTKLIVTDAENISSYKKKIKSYKSYIKSDLIEHKKKQKEVEDSQIESMREIKSLQESIYQIQCATDIDEDKSRIDAITAILDQYSVSFDMKLNVVRIGQEDFEVGINFIFNRKLCDKTIYFTINYNRRTILDFNASSFCSKDVELSHKKWYNRSNNNIAGLMYRLRNELLKTINS